MRVLHLIDSETANRSPMTLEVIRTMTAHADALRQQVWLLGGEALPTACAPRVDRELRPPLGAKLLMPAMLWRMREAIADQFDVIHAWSDSAAQLAQWAHWGPPMVRGFDWPPGCEASALAADREGLRQRWGADGQTFVLAALSDEPATLDAMLPTNVMGLAGEAGRSIKLLLPPDAPRRQACHDIHRTVGSPQRITCEDELATPWRVLAGCDAVLLSPPPGRAELSLAWAMLAGLPVICPAQLGGQWHEQVHRGAKVRDLASALRKMIDAPPDEATRQRWRAEAGRRFDPKRFADRRIERYQRVTGLGD